MWWKQWKGLYPHLLILPGFISLFIISFINRAVERLKPPNGMLIPQTQVITTFFMRKAAGSQGRGG